MAKLLSPPSTPLEEWMLLPFPFFQPQRHPCLQRIAPIPTQKAGEVHTCRVLVHGVSLHCSLERPVAHEILAH